MVGNVFTNDPLPKKQQVPQKKAVLKSVEHPIAIIVKDNRNELEYAKSAESDGLNLRKLTKTSFLGQFGHIWSILAPKHFFFKNPKTSLF